MERDGEGIFFWRQNAFFCDSSGDAWLVAPGGSVGGVADVGLSLFCARGGARVELSPPVFGAPGAASAVSVHAHASDGRALLHLPDALFIIGPPRSSRSGGGGDTARRFARCTRVACGAPPRDAIWLAGYAPDAFAVLTAKAIELHAAPPAGAGPSQRLAVWPLPLEARGQGGVLALGDAGRGWEALALFIVTAKGAALALCPLVPPSTQLPAALLARLAGSGAPSVAAASWLAAQLASAKHNQLTTAATVAHLARLPALQVIEFVPARALEEGEQVVDVATLSSSVHGSGPALVILKADGRAALVAAGEWLAPAWGSEGGGGEIGRAHV